MRIPFLVLALLIGCGPADEARVPVVHRVKVFEVGEETLGQIRTLSGQLAAADLSPLSFGVGGTVDRVNASEGDRVEEGQILATLDPEPLRLSASQARSRVSDLRAKLVEADREYERATALAAQGVLSRADLDLATTNARSARANLQGAQSQLDQAERDLARAELRAPFAGRIAERSVEPFQEVGASASVFVLQGNGALKVELGVPDQMVRNVDHGQAVRVGFPTQPDLELVGVVTQIGAQAGSGTTFPIEIQLPETERDLRPGMSARVTFNFGAYAEGAQVFLIPLSAVAIDGAPVEPERRREDERVPVYVVDEERGRVERREIRIRGLRGNFLEVFEGLAVGDQVVSSGVAFLRDDMEVEVWTPEQGLSGG